MAAGGAFISSAHPGLPPKSLSEDELDVLHDDAVKKGSAGQGNVWFDAIDAPHLDQLITEMNTMNKWFAKVVKYWDEFTSGKDGSSVYMQNLQEKEHSRDEIQENLEGRKGGQAPKVGMGQLEKGLEGEKSHRTEDKVNEAKKPAMKHGKKKAEERFKEDNNKSADVEKEKDVAEAKPAREDGEDYEDEELAEQEGEVYEKFNTEEYLEVAVEKNSKMSNSSSEEENDEESFEEK